MAVPVVQQRRRSLITQRHVPTIQKIWKTVEILQAQFKDDVVDVPVVVHMTGACGSEMQKTTKNPQIQCNDRCL